MNITATRSQLRAWALRQPETIRGQAETIARNLKGLKREPNNEPLLIQTKVNVARLEKTVMAHKTADETKTRLISDR